MKKSVKNILTALLLIAVVCASTVLQPTAVYAKTYDEGGSWKCKINGTMWYFDVSVYSDPDLDSDELGTVQIYKGKKNHENYKYCVSGEYVKVGTNKYKLTYDGGTITFKVSEKSIKVTQKKGKVKGIKLNNTFKLVEHFYS